MILPDKTIRLRNSILGTGALLLERMDPEETVSSLWDKVRENPEMTSFDLYVLSLDFLFSLGLVSFSDGMVRRY